MSSTQVPSGPEPADPKRPGGATQPDPVRTVRAATRRGSELERDGGATAPATPATPAAPAAPAAPVAAGRRTPAGDGERTAGRTPPQEGGSRSVDPAGTPTTVLPGGSGSEGFRRPARLTPGVSEPVATRAVAGRAAVKKRRTRLAVQRLDPWSVFLYSLVASLFLGVALVVAVAVLYAVLASLGVTQAVNDLFLELTGGGAAAAPLLTPGRFVGGAAVLAAVNVVLLTLLASLSALLYNLCASFTGGIEVTLGERDS